MTRARPRQVAPLPGAFAERMRAQLGEDEAAELLAALDRPSQRALRVNPLKAALDDVCAALGVDVDPVPWCTDATFLDEHAARAAASSPGHAAGLYYLQEPSAMAVVEALTLEPNALVLDAAASPGGKSTHLASAVGNGGVVVANEVVRGRVGALLDNVERWGAPGTIVVSTSLDRLARAARRTFAAAVVDAPCSGEAMFRKGDAARRAWSEAHVAGSARRQREVLASAAETVAPGGRLVYSTCTFNEDENEAVVASFGETNPTWSVASSTRYWPHRDRGDGHALTVLHHAAVDDAQSIVLGLKTGAKAPRLDPERMRRAEMALVEGFVADLDWGRVRRREDAFYLVPERALPDLPGVVRGGLPLGHLRHDRFEPSHALALSTLALGDAVDVVDVDDDDAGRFAGGHVLERDGPSGWVIVRWRGWRIGWGRLGGGKVKPRIPRRARTG